MGADPSKLHGQLAVRPKPVYPHHEGTPLPSGLDRPAWLLQFLHPPRSPLVLPPSAAAHPPDLPSPYPAYTILPVPPFTLLTQHSYNHGTHACAHTYMRAHTRLCPAHVRPTGTLPALQPQSQILHPSPAITLPIMTFAPSSFITPPPPLRGPSPGLAVSRGPCFLLHKKTAVPEPAGALTHCGWACKTGWLLYKAVWQLLLKLNIL